MSKTPREMFLEHEKRKQEEELAEIINKPTLTPEEIWSIFPENFYAWRKKYDYPRILSHFSKMLSRFEEWKKENKITDEILMGYGISNCINPNPAKDKKKFFVESEWHGQVSRFISYKNLDGKYYNLGPHLVNHKVTSSFIGYLDWCDIKGIKIIEGRRSNELLGLYSKTAHRTENVTVQILEGLDLLKIGGIKVEPDHYGLIKPKFFEFVNADCLTLEGRLHTSGLKLTIENSFVDNLTCQNLDLALVEIMNCHVSEINVSDSMLQQWLFYSSSVSGKMLNTDLSRVTVHDGSFNVNFRDCNFYNVEATQFKKDDVLLEDTYRTFKKIYADQGQDRKAIDYFLREKSVERQKIKQQIFKYHSWGLFKETKWEHLRNKTFHFISYSTRFIFHSINNIYWGYGRRPMRVVRNSLAFIFFFALIYYFAQSSMNLPANTKGMSFTDSIYYSTVTFTTLGYGDFYPLGYLRVAAASEAFLGGISLGFLVAGFSNSKY